MAKCKDVLVNTHQYIHSFCHDTLDLLHVESCNQNESRY